jgi:threonine dehydrogenase-like Zn-dependent dehydrogenase
MSKIPETISAVQLTGPDELNYNPAKKVYRPGPYQVLGRVEAVGLCFSDLKLLKQFSGHVRKSEVLGGVEAGVLDEIPSYAPGEEPTVPGHEVVITVVEAGEKVRHAKVGGRYLVQADYRWVRTANSNGAFGYNFEGGLQEYVLIDERVSTSPDGESMLLGVAAEAEHLSSSSIALVEPWACVEDAYAVRERVNLVEGGRMFVAADEEVDGAAFKAFIGRFGKPGSISCIGNCGGLDDIGVEVKQLGGVDDAADGEFDDVIYFGSRPEMVEGLFGKLAANGLFNAVLCGGQLGRDVEIQIGRIHYGNLRIVGTRGSDPAESMENIPASGEIRDGDKIDIVGAAGPMGVMHVIRDICQGVSGITVYAGDLDEARLSHLTKIAEPMAEKNGVKYLAYNPRENKPDEEFGYTVLMAPVPALVTAAVKSAAEKGIINIFAGIPATKTGTVDLDRCIEKHIYFIGTSGSVLNDMKIVLGKVEAKKLDTDVSVGAVSGLASAVEGIRAVENRSIAGKIIVYPACKDMGLIKLEELGEHYSSVAEKLENGLWNKAAEDELLKVAAG